MKEKMLVVFFIILLSCKNRTDNSVDIITYDKAVEHSTQGVVIEYFAKTKEYIDQYENLEQEKQDQVIDYIKKRTGIELKIINPYRNLRYVDMEPLKILKIMLENGKIDLVYYNEYLHLEDNLIMEEHFINVIDLIETHAPFICIQNITGITVAKKDMYMASR